MEVSGGHPKTPSRQGAEILYHFSMCIFMFSNAGNGNEYGGSGKIQKLHQRLRKKVVKFHIS
jgi:hypothetical protein